MGPSAQLSDGGPELFRDPLGAGKVFRAWPQAGCTAAGQGDKTQGKGLIADRYKARRIWAACGPWLVLDKGEKIPPFGILGMKFRGTVVRIA